MAFVKASSPAPYYAYDSMFSGHVQEGHHRQGSTFNYNLPTRSMRFHSSTIDSPYADNAVPRFMPRPNIRSFDRSYDDTPRNFQVTSAASSHRDGPSGTEREHRERLTCTWPGCSATFSRKADANRHMTSTHEVELIDCDVRGCARVGDNGFARKDHLLEHKRGYHCQNLPKRHTRTSKKSRHDKDVWSPAASSHKYDRGGSERAPTPTRLSSEDHLTRFMTPSAKQTPASSDALPAGPAIPPRYRPPSKAFAAPQARKTSENHSESYDPGFPSVPSPCNTEISSINHGLGVESPSGILNTSRHWTPVSNSAQSTIESEGERSFVDPTDYEDYYSLGPADHTLTLHLAQLSLRNCVHGSYRAARRTTAGSSGGSTSRSWQPNPESSTSLFLSSSLTSNKRPFNSRRDSGDWDEAEDSKDTKKTCRSSSDRSAGNRLLACPYYRFDAARYSERNTEEVFYRGCSIVCLRDISRLKQHLYRVHRRPDYYCGSCYCVFASQNDLDAHTRKRPACENAPSRYEEKIHRDQMNAIKRRTMGTDPVEEWSRIYTILFPESSLPPVSFVYADGDSSVAVQEYLAYFQAEAPSLLLDLVRSQTDGRIPLNEEHRDILNEAFEYAASRVVSRLRPRLDESEPPRPNTQGGAQQTGRAHRLANVTQSGSNAEELPPLPDSSQAWSVIHAEPGDWPHVGQEEWLNLGLADWEHHQDGSSTVSRALDDATVPAPRHAIDASSLVRANRFEP